MTLNWYRPKGSPYMYADGSRGECATIKISPTHYEATLSFPSDDCLNKQAIFTQLYEAQAWIEQKILEEYGNDSFR